MQLTPAGAKVLGELSTLTYQEIQTKFVELLVALQRVVDTLGGVVASYVVADVTQPAEVQGYVQTALERYQGIDILLANAGGEGVIQPITDYPVDVFDRN